MAESIFQESIQITGLPGAVAATRYAGATVSGYPTSGSFLAGDHIIDQTGLMWVCIISGTPGTWAQIGGGSIAGTISFTNSDQTFMTIMGAWL